MTEFAQNTGYLVGNDIDGFGERVSDLPTISLANLNARASLQRRIDTKYVVPARSLSSMLGFLPQGTRVLETAGGIGSAYRSTYFDTDDLDLFFLAARGRRRRYKVRTRTYDDGSSYVEVKTKGSRGMTSKTRTQRENPSQTLTWAETSFARDQLTARGCGADSLDRLVPMLLSDYVRYTFLVPAGPAEVRMTIDTNVAWQDARDGGTGGLACKDLAIVEVKSPIGSHDVTRMLSQLGMRSIRVSKYCTGMVLLHPHLPAHRWHRVRQLLISHATAVESLS